MAKVTWLGEDEENIAGPSWTTWQNMRFDKGRAVEITNNEILAKAKGNRFFKVEGGPGRPFGSTTARKVEAEDDDENQK
jgi:hypothetical protein